MTVKNSLPIEKKEKVLVSTLNGTFFHEKTNSGFVQINRIEGNSVQNGTPTPDNPIEVKSFSGEVVTSGKNLYDLSKAYTKNGVLELIKNGFRCKGVSYIYYDIFIPSGWAFRLTWKKSNETLYNHCNVVFDNGSFGTAENGAGYGVNGRNVVGLHLAISNTTNENVDITDIILEVTKFGTEFPFDYYEPFHATKMEKLTLYGGMPNGINDTLERQPDGSYLLTQRYKEFVLDGSEEWNKKRSDSPAGKSVFHLANNPGVKYVLKGDNNSTPYGRNYLSSIGFATWADSEREGIGGWTGTDGDRDNTDIMINLKTSRLATDDIAGLKAWLKANPVTCVMELIQPIQRKLWLSPLSAYEGQTNIFANSEVGAEMEVEVLTTNAVNEKLQELKGNIVQERQKEVPLLIDGKRIFENEDLNDYAIIGNYYCLYGSETVSLKNIPNGLRNGFTMVVRAGNGKIFNNDIEDDYFLQIIESYHGETYKRLITRSGQNKEFYYGSWTKVLTNKEELLWSGSMAKGQSAVVDGLSNFKKLKIFVESSGYIELDDFNGPYLKHGIGYFQSNLTNYIKVAFVETGKTKDTFTNVACGYCDFSQITSKTSANDFTNKVTEIWGIY